MPKLCIELDDRDYQTLRLAAVISDSQSLKAWATRKLLATARQIVTEYKDQTLHPDVTETSGIDGDGP